MKKLAKGTLLVLVISLTIGQLYASCWAQAPTDPTEQGLAMMDLMVARPASAVAGVIGAALFFVTLPFTIPTNSMEASAHMFVVEPMKFAFEREFPDENLRTRMNMDDH
jgi:hypothetical protein